MVSISRSTPIELSLVVPLYNEEASVNRVVGPLLKVLEDGGIPYELVLVNNGSSDGTGPLLEQWAQRSPAVRLVTVAVNEGYGWGIIQGLRQAQGKYVGFMSGDGQIQPQDPVRVYRAMIATGSAVAKVTRVVRGDGRLRRINSHCYNQLCRVLFGVRSRDFNGTPKIVSRAVLEALDLSSRDWFIDAELMLKSRWLGYEVLEVPTEYLARPSGRSKVRFSAVWEFLANIVHARWGGRFQQWKAVIHSAGVRAEQPVESLVK